MSGASQDQCARRFHRSWRRCARLQGTGKSWGQRTSYDQCDSTPTSHIYTTKGSYVIDLDIRFGAEYRYADSGWLPIAGTIDVPAKRLRVTVGDARTVLVNHDCLANPAGPGC
jgi:hypothetical protein